MTAPSTPRRPTDRRQDTCTGNYIAEHRDDRRKKARREQDVTAALLAAGQGVGRGTYEAGESA